MLIPGVVDLMIFTNLIKAYCAELALKDTFLPLVKMKIKFLWAAASNFATICLIRSSNDRLICVSDDLKKKHTACSSLR